MSPLHTLLLAVALILATVSAVPLQTRDVAWSFRLFPTAECNGPGDPHSGRDSTGCRANLPSIAAAYQVDFIAGDCRVEFFDNTMCEPSSAPDPVDVAYAANNVQSCRVPASMHRYGSYKVTCGETKHEEI